ncbi:pyridoxamine 5'-phosphate oxidase family protein [Variovorax sp. VNK109]|uniref:pyridoxamine 5'-phosphate oxidase family protein n=1 Tax=Variovorax sp. VNK109 TaxID=3400919 RepID=UPI003C0F141D
MADKTAHDTLWELIKDIRFGMFTHRHSDGKLHSHPLTTQNKSLDADRNLYFFVSRSGEVARRVASDGLVNIAYADTGKDSYVSITGQASVIENAQIVERLWSKPAEAWFPGGPADPDLQLLQVRIVEAEYWDVKDSKVTQLFKMAKSLFTDEPPKDMAEHKVL